MALERGVRSATHPGALPHVPIGQSTGWVQPISHGKLEVQGTKASINSHQSHSTYNILIAKPDPL